MEGGWPRRFFTLKTTTYKYSGKYSDTTANKYVYEYTVEPPNNGHIGDKHFVHCSEVVSLSEVEMYGQ